MSVGAGWVGDLRGGGVPEGQIQASPLASRTLLL